MDYFYDPLYDQTLFHQPLLALIPARHFIAHKTFMDISFPNDTNEVMVLCALTWQRYFEIIYKVTCKYIYTEAQEQVIGQMNIRATKVQVVCRGCGGGGYPPREKFEN